MSTCSKQVIHLYRLFVTILQYKDKTKHDTGNFVFFFFLLL